MNWFNPTFGYLLWFVLWDLLSFKSKHFISFPDILKLYLYAQNEMKWELWQTTVLFDTLHNPMAMLWLVKNVICLIIVMSMNRIFVLLHHSYFELSTLQLLEFASIAFVPEITQPHIINIRFIKFTFIYLWFT
jgi:hypothetical protein